MSYKLHVVVEEFSYPSATGDVLSGLLKGVPVVPKVTLPNQTEVEVTGMVEYDKKASLQTFCWSFKQSLKFAATTKLDAKIPGIIDSRRIEINLASGVEAGEELRTTKMYKLDENAETFTIPPNASVEISAEANFLRNFETPFTAVAKITATSEDGSVVASGDDVMSVLKRFEGATLKRVEENAVLFEVSGTFLGTYGINNMVSCKYRYD